MDKLDQGKKGVLQFAPQKRFPPGNQGQPGLLALLFDGNNWVK